MSESRRCPTCGAELAEALADRPCPACLMKLGLEHWSLKGGRTLPADAPGAFGHGARRPAPTVEELAPRFPQLEILELVGQGGMGAVYKARQRDLDRLVALKILPPQIAADPSFAERFTREARALARLNHPHVVTVYDFGQADGLFYFVMEFVDGANLRRLLDAGDLAPRDAIAIVPQICDALQYAHEEGIVHRDIKPENILLDRRGRVKIADFGLAKLLHSYASTQTDEKPGIRELSAADYRLTAAGQVMGTPHYMAPEQMERPLEVDHRADIYSLGVVFYEMLTGQLPLGQFAPPSARAVIDVRLDEVVLRALEREPERRYQRASEVKSDVEAVMPAETLAARSTVSPAGQELERRATFPWRFRLGVVGLFALAWIVTGAMWNYREVGLAIAAVVMLGAGAGAAFWMLRFLPEVRRERSRQSRLRRSISLSAAALLLLFAWWWGIGGYCLNWEFEAWTSARQQFRRTGGFQADGAELLKPLRAFAGQPPRTDLYLLGGGSARQGEREHIWIALMCAAIAVIAVWGAAIAFVDTRRLRYTWQGFWKPSLALAWAGVAGFALPCAVVSIAGVGGQWNRGWPSVSCDAEIGRVEETLAAWAEKHGYVRGVNHTSATLEQDSGASFRPLAEYRQLELVQASPFDRFRMTRFGFRRPFPPLNIQCIANVEGQPETFVSIRAADYLSSSDEERDWTPVLDDLVATLERL